MIAVEMQGHGRTADITRDFSYENLADDLAALLDHLNIPSADLIGYSMGGGVALQCAIRHEEKVRKVVSISAVFRHDGWVKEVLDTYPQFTAEAFTGSPIETDYQKLSPTPDQFGAFVKRVIAMDLQPYDFGADKLKAKGEDLQNQRITEIAGVVRRIQQLRHDGGIRRFGRPWLVADRPQAASGRRRTDSDLDQPRTERG